MVKKWFVVVAICAVCLSGLVDAEATEEKPLMMATTTSTDNTGLLEYLAPKFQEATGIELRWTATGTGKALALGKNCDVDVLLVHAPSAEKEYVEQGFGKNRREIMFNDFVIIGPAADPVSIKGQTVTDALSAIRDAGSVFVSRGDNSGTHKKEKSLWEKAEVVIDETQKWYVQTGQGMLSTINVAAEREGYTMTDRGTYIKYEANMKGNPPLVVLVEGDPILMNQYSVIAVNPEKCENVQFDKAMKFSEWMAGEQAQKLIESFTLLDKKLFIPNAK